MKPLTSIAVWITGFIKQHVFSTTVKKTKTDACHFTTKTRAVTLFSLGGRVIMSFITSADYNFKVRSFPDTVITNIFDLYRAEIMQTNLTNRAKLRLFISL